MLWPQKKPSKINTLLQTVSINISLGAYLHGKILEHFHPILEIFSKVRIEIVENLLAAILLPVTFRMDTHLGALHEVSLINVPSTFFSQVGTTFQQAFASDAFL